MRSVLIDMKERGGEVADDFERSEPTLPPAPGRGQGVGGVRLPLRPFIRRGAGLLTAGIGLLLAASLAAQAQTVKILVQSSPLAGFQYHAGPQVWERLRVGDALVLVREPDNPHDARAVRVHWQGVQLGYLPRAENEAVAAAMDRGERVSARIAALAADRNPWRRLRIEIFVML